MRSNFFKQISKDEKKSITSNGTPNLSTNNTHIDFKKEAKEQDKSSDQMDSKEKTTVKTGICAYTHQKYDTRYLPLCHQQEGLQSPPL